MTDASNVAVAQNQGTILVVDDASTMRAYLESLLSDQGYTVITAMNGVEAISKAKIELPDLIFCDVNMPQMNGYDAVRGLRKDPDTHAIPVAMLTTEGAESDVDMAIQSGANFHMVKPPKPDIVHDVAALFTAHKDPSCRT